MTPQTRSDPSWKMRRHRDPSALQVPLKFLVPLALLVLPAVTSDSPAPEYCEPHDYERQSSICTAGQRTVQYAKARTCEDPFATIAGQPHQEQCECSPEDYAIVYGFEASEDGGTKCMMRYVPKNVTVPAPSGDPSCEAKLKKDKFEVDEAYCELSQVACTEENILVAYSECIYPNNNAELESGAPAVEGSSSPDSPFFEVIYYFDSVCSPSAKGSIRLPPRFILPCNIKCGAGSALVKTQCQQCPAGSFSSGGALRFKKFYTEPTKKEGFEYSCQYTNATGTFYCDNWHVEADTLAVGPFNEPNNWYQDECASDPAYDCYNNLKAMLRMTVKLKRAGYVKFKYTVSAEKDYDGLSFFIDVEEEPEMPLQSVQFEAKEVQFPLTEGFHVLTWVYSKDEKFTAGTDTASISELEIDGVEFNDLACETCEAGFFSAAGASECTPCPLNFYSGANSTACQPCPEDQYSLVIPRTQCYPRQPCDASKDIGVAYTPCMKSTKKRTKKYHWLKPHICLGTLPPEEEEDCPPCPAGQFATEYPDSIKCEFCPPGTARQGPVPGQPETAPEACIKCEQGFVAIKELNLAHIQLEPDQQLPWIFATGCSQGDCGDDRGWRLAGGALTSGRYEEPSVAVWLKMNVTLEMIGEVSFNFSVDIPAGDESRGFFFYIDGTPIDEMVDNGEGSLQVSSEPMMSGPWQMEKGDHTIMWKWVKANSTIPAQRDSAIIYDIKIRGVTEGGASVCERVPDGAQLVGAGSSWEECPPGYYSDGGISQCAACPANTFNPYPFGGKWACLQCGAGTTSVEASTSCEIGDVNVPSSFCQYFRHSAANSSKLITYDLAPLSRVHPGSMYGPVYQDPSSNEADNGALYYISICDRQITNHTCMNNARKPLNTTMCRVNPRNKVLGSFRPAHSLGDRIALQPLGEDSRLERRGFRMILNGERCFGNQIETNTTVSFICDPTAGYGTPRAWTVAAKSAAYNPEAEFPHWIDRSASMVIPVGSQETCSYELVWYSAFACPLCTQDDYESVEVSGCKNNTRVTWKYKQPQLCQPNPEEPLPQNVPCRPCTTDDYQELRDACSDEKGNHNITYTWLHPKLCDDTVEGAATLPSNVVAGPCVHTVYLESADLLKPQYIALMVLGGLAIVVLAVTSFITWLRSRKIYAMYSRLVANENGDGDFGEHDEEMEEVEGTNEDTRLNDEEEDEEDNTLEVSADPTEYRRHDDDRD